ncbi:glycosyltransferase [Candidatus Thiothrix sp. Deng01]|uniref:Glycosyltransferase n=1 Tax=Candidatus Thiothrix phosphatis TaxID=3112415 RepID=A0ABU6CTN0_9GAMM|nr:glycosyltransferase [Candidatus Thiothrix sp. Deng01]MEB4590150.1 glycosyltransferase [Candidatus Thiothrix sp. Deng01]
MRKKIALIVYSLGMGGAEKVVSDLSFQFAKQHDVTLILFDGSRMYYPYAGELIDLRCPSKSGFVAKTLNFLERSGQLKRIFQAKRFDVIISVMEHANFPSILASRRTIAANHCNPDRNFSQLDWLFAKWLYPRAKMVVAVSQDGMRIFQQRLGLQNITCLYNPVNLNRIRELAKERPAVHIDGQYIVAAGRLSPEKNFSMLIDAYAAAGIREDFKLLILGEGGGRPVLEQQVKAQGLEKQVILPGFMRNPYPYIANAHCLAMSSLHEGFPVILIEALGLGRPVISTDCETGPREIIQHDSNGLLTPSDDREAMSAALDRLCLDVALHARLQQNAAASVEYLDIEKVAEQWLAL